MLQCELWSLVLCWDLLAVSMVMGEPHPQLGLQFNLHCAFRNLAPELKSP